MKFEESQTGGGGFVMKCGLALEGGGAKGAYHIGVVKALYEEGYEFDGFVGTSIGAINSAILAQGDYNRALDLWMDISADQIFKPEDKSLLSLIDLGGLELNADFFSNAKGAISKVISGKGVSTEKMLSFLKGHISEEKVRASGKDFGLVTISLSERKPCELMLEDIPRGKLIDYVMASASFPGFSSITIDDKKYFDGGVYNNCPVNLLEKRGYDEIIAVRAGAPGMPFQSIDKKEKVKIISPQENTGNMMVFSPEISSANIKMGYCDGMRFIKELRGSYFYIKASEIDVFNAKVMSLDEAIISEVASILGTKGITGKRILFEKIIPRLGSYLGLEKDFDYTDFTIALLERRAKQYNIERYDIYDYKQLCALVEERVSKSTEKAKVKTKIFKVSKNERALDLLTDKLL